MNAAIGAPKEARSGYKDRILAKTAASCRIAGADLILPNGPQYARGRDPSTGEEFRRTPPHESPLLPTAGRVAGRPPRPKSPWRAKKGEFPLPLPVSATRVRILGG